MLAQLLWVHPGWLWLLPVVAAAAVWAHLLSRWGAVLVVLPTAKFLPGSNSLGIRKHRPRQWALLALRMSLLIAVLLAFAQPRWQRRAVIGPPGIRLAVVIDRSASMTRVVRGRSLWERAKEAAVDRLGRLEPGRDRANVVLMDRQPHWLLVEPSDDPHYLAQRLAELGPTFERGDAGAALALAATMPGDGQMQVEIFTDDQGTQWRDGPVPVGRVTRLSASIENVAVHSPAVAALPLGSRQGREISVRISNFGLLAVQRTIEWTWEGGRRGRWSQTLALAAGESLTLTRSFDGAADAGSLEAGGLRVRVAALPADVLPEDDATELWLPAPVARRVWLVSDSRFDDASSGAWFVQRAIEPDDPGGFSVRRMTRQELAAAMASSSPDALVLIECGRLAPETLDVLRPYIQSGGAVVWVVDSEGAASALGALCPVSWRMNGAAGKLGAGAFEHSVLRVFAGPARADLLGATLQRGWGAAIDARMTPLLWWSGGEAALWRDRQTNLAVLAADLAPTAGDLATRPSFLPLWHQLLADLMGTVPNVRFTNVGEAISLPLDRAGRGVSPLWDVRQPDGRIRRLAALDSAPAALPLDVLRQVGLYTLCASDAATRDANPQAGESEGPVIVMGVMAQIDPAESDLRPLPTDADQPQSWVPPPQPATLVSATPDRRPRELWPWLILAALALAWGEQVVAAGAWHPRKERHDV